MTNTPIRRFWIPAFATDRGVRTALQCLYVSLVGSSENARSLIERDPSMLDHTVAVGNKLTRRCFGQAVRWLTRVREFAVSEEVFNGQVLEAMRAPARFLLSVREQRPSTTTLNGLVFAKSPQFYDKYYEDNVIDISLLCPVLGSGMCFRYKEETLRDVGCGAYELSGVQPVPLVNRIHPFSPQARKIDVPMELRRLHPFKASWGDSEALAGSWCFENFTQIYCRQTDRKQLGMACILSGKFVNLSAPRMILQSPAGDQESCEVMFTEPLVAQYGYEEAKIRALVGRYVRLLVVFWYSYGFSRARRILPEAFLMEEAGGLDEARLDDAIGFVRARKRVSEQQFLSHYTDRELMGLPPEFVRRGRGLLEWTIAPAGDDRIIGGFLEQVRTLGESRVVENSVSGPRLIRFRDVIDSRKLGMEHLSRIVSMDPTASGLLLLLITSEDTSQVLHSWDDVVRGIGGVNLDARDRLGWLRDVGLVTKKGGGVRITPYGRRVWYSANRNPIMASIEKFLAGRRGSFDIFEIIRSVNYPRSAIVAGLDELEKAGIVKCFRASSQEFKLFWAVVGDDSRNSTRQEDTPMIRDTLLALMSAGSALSTRKLLEKLKESDSRWDDGMLLSVLTYLKKCGRIGYEREPSGNEMWLYTHEQRISDLFAKNPERSFTLDEVVQAIHGSSEETSHVLRGLVSRGVIASFGDYWFTGDRAKAMRSILRSQCAELTKSLIRELGGAVSEARLIFELNQFLRAKASEFGLEGEVRQVSEKMIQAMAEGGVIVRKGSSYWLGPG